jgi:hypothetical protein
MLGVGLAPLSVAAQDAARNATAGMRVYVDPETGERLAAPPAAAAPRRAAALAAGLVEEVNPRGGYVVHLQQRFRGAMTAHAEDKGKVSVGCETDAAAVRE